MPRIRRLASSPLFSLSYIAILIFCSLSILPRDLFAQETAFGKNKVVYKDYDWHYIQSRHFDIYFYENEYDLAKFAAETIEDAYDKVSKEIDYSLRTRIPVFIYLSPNDFQTTNITGGILPEGVNGFTEVFKKRVVVHFNGSYEDFRHLLHHELTHAMVYDLLFGNSLSSMLSRGRFFDLPLWFAEGYAEYSSREHWFYQSDMIVRDATINGYIRPPGQMGILAYTVGAGLVKYIADEYGEEKLGDLLRKGKLSLSMDKAIQSTLGISMEKLWDDYTLQLRQRYWPDIANRKMPDKLGKQLTHHGKDNSYYNEKPVFSPKGDQIAIFSDREDFTEIYLISAADGTVIKKLTKAERSGDLESLHSYFSGITFSPDGDSICFVAKSNGQDALFFMDIRNNDIYRKKRIDANGLLSPVWSPDGKLVAYSALLRGQRDLFVYDIAKDSLIQLTDDLHDDRDACWNGNSESLVFSSDRPHPDNNVQRDVRVDKTGAFVDSDGNPLPYGGYNLFSIDMNSRKVKALPVGEGNNSAPTVSPDGKKLLFISNRNVVDNMYIHYMDSTGSIAISDLLTGAGSPSWSPNGREIAFSSFNGGAFDIFVMKDITAAGEAGVLKPTAYYAGEYKGGFTPISERHEVIDSSAAIWSPATMGWVDSGDATDRHKLLAGVHDSSQVIDANESGITDQGDFVYVSPRDSAKADSTTSDSAQTSDEEQLEESQEDPLAKHLTDVPSDDIQAKRRPDTLATKPPPDNKVDGEYAVRDYKVHFTTDLIAAGASFDTFFGLQGSSFIALSDYLGNHQLIFGFSSVGNVDQTDLQAIYLNSTHRTRWGAGLFHFYNYYEDNRNFIFSDRFLGLQTMISHPFSTFRRFDLNLAFSLIDRTYRDFFDQRKDRTATGISATASMTHDNVLWGLTGPVKGSRSKLSVTAAMDPFHNEFRLYNDSSLWPNGLPSAFVPDNPDSTVKALQFVSAEVDMRKYWHIYRAFSMAFRLSGGASFGETPKRYFLGGTTNWIGTSIDNAEAFDVDNLYYADVVTPLRSYEYYELSGSRYFLGNIEFRFPLVDYLQLHFPLPLALARVQGALFFDIGAVWDKDELHFATSQNGPTRLDGGKAGFGWGFRMNLGIFLLRYDLAWKTDLASVADSPRHYFSFGADF